MADRKKTKVTSKMDKESRKRKGEEVEQSKYTVKLFWIAQDTPRTHDVCPGHWEMGFQLEKIYMVLHF